MDNYIVFLKDGSKHSAWRSKQEALHQRQVLIDHGYSGQCYIEQIDHTYENGQYFV